MNFNKYLHSSFPLLLFRNLYYLLMIIYLYLMEDEFGYCTSCNYPVEIIRRVQGWDNAEDEYNNKKNEWSQ